MREIKKLKNKGKKSDILVEEKENINILIQNGL